MSGYISYFKTQILTGLQYRTSAFAGILTQIFWGFLNVMVFTAFYAHASSDSINLEQLITYVWLNQAFLILIYIRVKDNDIMESIKNGTVAYELCRPYNLYKWWYIKFLSQKYAAVILRFLPIIIISLILPEPYKLQLPNSGISFMLFIITLILGSLVLVAILMIIQSISFFTYQDKGISDIVFILADILAGAALPLPLLPKFIQNFSEYLPFRLIGDLPFRVYSGNIGTSYALKSIGLQIIWIIILYIIGQLIMKKAVKKVCIQGG